MQPEPAYPVSELEDSPWVDIPDTALPATCHEISPSLRSKIRALKQFAGWTYRKISSVTGVALTTVFRTCQPLITYKRPSTCGRKHLLGLQDKERLITLATASAENHRKPLTEIAFRAGITASEKTLRDSLASEGYHQRIARVQPYLKPSYLEVSIYFFFLSLLSYFDLIVVLFCLYYYFCFLLRVFSMIASHLISYQFSQISLLFQVYTFIL